MQPGGQRSQHLCVCRSKSRRAPPRQCWTSLSPTPATPFGWCRSTLKATDPACLTPARPVSPLRVSGVKVQKQHTHTHSLPSCVLLLEPLGFARNLQVLDPTTSTLNVRWDPAEGNVREYIVIWAPASGGGEQEVVRLRLTAASVETPVRCSTC